MVKTTDGRAFALWWERETEALAKERQCAWTS